MVETGLLRALAHPQLSRALAAIHADPTRAWTLAAMTQIAAMSRSRFAAAFKAQLGETPGEYLTRWRISIAQALIRRGTPTKLLPEKTGYRSQAGFLRAFKLVIGVPPRAWAASQTEITTSPQSVRLA